MAGQLSPQLLQLLVVFCAVPGSSADADAHAQGGVGGQEEDEEEEVEELWGKITL